MHAKKAACCVHCYHAAVGELLAGEREPKNAIGMYLAVKTDDLSDSGWKLSRICHESPAGIEKVVVSREIATCS